jgi:hypothetical protein
LLRTSSNSPSVCDRRLLKQNRTINTAQHRRSGRRGNLTAENPGQRLEATGLQAPRPRVQEPSIPRLYCAALPLETVHVHWWAGRRGKKGDQLSRCATCGASACRRISQCIPHSKHSCKQASKHSCTHAFRHACIPSYSVEKTTLFGCHSGCYPEQKPQMLRLFQGLLVLIGLLAVPRTVKSHGYMKARQLLFISLLGCSVPGWTFCIIDQQPTQCQVPASRNWLWHGNAQYRFYNEHSLNRGGVGQPGGLCGGQMAFNSVFGNNSGTGPTQDWPAEQDRDSRFHVKPTGSKDPLAGPPSLNYIGYDWSWLGCTIGKFGSYLAAMPRVPFQQIPYTWNQCNFFVG